MTYTEAVATLAGRTARKIGNNTILRMTAAGAVAVQLHGTDVITFHPDGSTVTLNSGGWRTVTTKARMNEYLPFGCRVVQRDFHWTVCSDSGDTVRDFYDGISITASEGDR